ncbi:bifunctional 2-C-methyl-D-erythritol 4-phosphate cytidylyltransferase/2-C-methyl-D-erythritol 2,4-cyclodiphosphate synthase [Altererythrobacter sp.]|nr:bifunctional 2-C-methyl-D-erythritol 4-phosphate cytidylyltransferase/2-C-methyl-D-erythritol 2,4-cyclodiphosphate synthase [Altererythrobacter sp.]
MRAAHPLPPFAAVIVAAGKGLRAGQPIPKQFARWRGKPVLRHSVEALAEAGALRIVVAVPEGAEPIAIQALQGIGSVRFVTGGATRQESVRLALDILAGDAPERVLIHDAARPLLPQTVIGRVLDALEDNAGAIPSLPVVDSLAVDAGGRMTGAADRNALRRVQTPQAFRFRDILAAHHSWKGELSAGDDAQVLCAAGSSVSLVEGDETLKKLTFAEDFDPIMPPVRVGTGYDVHRLAAGEDLWLGGIQLQHDKGLAGHSDADVALHAIVDALLGAIGQGDIGDHFPPSDERWKGAASSAFLRHAISLVAEAGYAVGNIDLTIICEAPKIGPHRENMRARIAELCGCEVSQISVKATTTEKLGFTGRSEGIAAQAVAAVTREG